MDTAQYMLLIAPLVASAAISAVGYVLKRAVDRAVEALRDMMRRVYEHETRIAVNEQRLDGHDHQFADVRGRLERAGA